MALPLKTGADLYTQELIRARLQNFGGDLPEYGAGSIYFNTIDDTTVNSSNRIRYRGLRAWHSIANMDDIDALQKQLDELDFAGSEEFIALEGRVSDVEGKFTGADANNALKLGGQLPSYYATASDLESFKALFSDDTDGYINTWEEVKAFLDKIEDTKDLNDILLGINNDLADRYTKAESDTLLNAKADWFAAIPDNSFKAIGYGYAAQGFWTSGPALSFGANSTYFAQLQAEGSGVKETIKFRRHDNTGYRDWVTLLHSGNYSDLISELNGLTIKGQIKINNANPAIKFANGNVVYGHLAWNPIHGLVMTDPSWDKEYILLRSDNYSDLVTTLNNQLTVPSIKIGGIILDVVDGNLRISGNAYATGELGSGQVAGEGGGGSTGGGYTAFDDSVTWADYDDSMADWLLTAYHGKLFNDRIATLENKATKVEVSNLLTSGTKIATIKVDANSYDILAPSTDWSAITNKPTTIGGYGITDAFKAYGNSGTNSLDLNTIKVNGSYYIGSSSTNKPSTYGQMLSLRNLDTTAQVYVGFNTYDNMYWRGFADSDTNIMAWRKILDENNYDSVISSTYTRKEEVITYNKGIDISGDTIPLHDIGYGMASNGWERNAVAMSIGYSQSYWAQLQFGNGLMTFRTNVGGTMSDWVKILTDTNYETVLNKTYLRNDGAAIKGYLSISAAWPAITFIQNDVRGEGIGVNQGKLVCYNAAGTNTYEILHANNFASVIGSTYIKPDGSVKMTRGLSWGKLTSEAWNTFTTDTGDGLRILNAVGATVEGAPSQFAVGLSISGYYGFCLAYEAANQSLMYKAGIAVADWKTIAFTDSDITGNAATATKLKNSVKLWGNTFDGSSSINSSIFLANNTALYFATSDSKYINVYSLSSTNDLIIGSGTTYDTAAYSTYLYGNNIYFRSGKNNTTAMEITDSGNTIIKTALILENEKSLYFYNSTKTQVYNAFTFSKNNVLYVGYDNNTFNGYATQIYGGSIAFLTAAAGGSPTQAMKINESGNVVIGGYSPVLSRKLTVNNGGTFLYAHNGGTASPDLGTPFEKALLVGYDTFGMQIWTNSNGSSYIQNSYFNGTATAFPIYINPLGGNVHIGSANASTNVLGDLRTNTSGNGFAISGRKLFLATNGISADTFLVEFAPEYVAYRCKLSPSVNNTYSLGSASYRWSDVYSVKGDFSTSIKIGEATLSYENGALKVDKNFFAEGEVASGKVAEEGTGGNTPSGSGLEIKTFDIASTTDNQMVELAHNLGTRDVVVQIFENSRSSNYQQVFADVYYVDTAKVAINFGAAQTVPHRVIIMG